MYVLLALQRLTPALPPAPSVPRTHTGYEAAAAVAKRAHAEGISLREAALALGVVGSADEFDRLVRPELMLRPSTLSSGAADGQQGGSST